MKTVYGFIEFLNMLTVEIEGFHGDEYEDGCLLGCSIV